MVMATVTSKGQVTIPKSVRKALKIEAGDQIEFSLKNGKEAVIRPISKRVDQVFGRLQKRAKSPVSIEQMNLAVKRRMEGHVHENP